MKTFRIKVNVIRLKLARLASFETASDIRNSKQKQGLTSFIFCFGLNLKKERLVFVYKQRLDLRPIDPKKERER